MGLPDAQKLLLEERKARIRQVVSWRTRAFVVVLDKLEDTFNMAAVLRTCEGMGLQEVHVVDNPEHPFRPHPKVTQGCDKWLDIHRYKDFARCQKALSERGFLLLASAAGQGAQSLYELKFDRPTALVFGNERFGISKDALALCDGQFWIPMRGFTQSFNISVAVAATLSCVRARREGSVPWGGGLPPEDAEGLTDRFFRLSLKQRKRIYREKPK